VSPSSARGVVRRSGDKEEELAHEQSFVVMPPGTRTTMKALADSPEAMEVSAVWAVTILRAFFNKALQATSIVDIQVAAGAALQDLDELQGLARYEEPLEGAA
jgi:hypothetical protein